jgi:hypothetical protein
MSDVEEENEMVIIIKFTKTYNIFSIFKMMMIPRMISLRRIFKNNML